MPVPVPARGLLPSQDPDVYLSREAVWMLSLRGHYGGLIT